MIDAIIDHPGVSPPAPDCAADEATAGALPMMVTVWRRDLTCDFANDACRAWFGRSPDEIVGSHLRDLLGDRLFEINRPFVEGALAGREQRSEGPLVKRDGRNGRTIASYIPRLDGTGDVLGVVVQVLDVTPMVEARRVLSLASLVYDCMRESVVVADLGGTIVSVNPAFTAVTGYERDEVVGRNTEILGLGGTSRQLQDVIRREIAAKGFWQGDVWSRRKNGDSFLAEQTLTVAHGPDGEAVHYVALFHDVTAARRDLHRLSQQARRDMLTGLANRGVLLERLDGLTHSTGREPTPFTVLFVDLDDFKTVNDVWGHDAGDRVLRVVAMRLTSSVRRGDLVARLAGDEFVVVAENRDGATGAMEIAERIKRSIARPIPFGEATISIEASIGHSAFPEDDTTASGLITRADARMYEAKNRSGS